MIKRVSYDQHTLVYRTYGTGQEPLLAFHGFGRDGTDFAAFEPFLGEKYTIYAFDLFYHGSNSEVLSDISPADSSTLAHLVDKLLWQDKKVKFSIMGYSLGGRVALCLIQKLPHRINEVFLLAPDGLRKEWHEMFFAKTLPGRIMYKKVIKSPGLFFGIVDALTRIRLLHPKMKTFIEQNLENTEKRRMVYNTWRIFRNTYPDISVVAHYINSKKIRLELIFGLHDKIIRHQHGKKLWRKTSSRSGMHLIETGHQLMSRAEEISAIILR